MIYVENGGSAYFIEKEQLPEYIMRGFHIPHIEKTVTIKADKAGSETKIKQAEPKPKKRTTKTVNKGVNKDVR